MSEKKSVVEAKDDNKELEFSGVVGTPSALLLPARNYKFNVYKDNHIITLPRKGKYVDLDPEAFADDDESFDFLQESKEEGSVMYVPAISKVLFAVEKYPDLEDGQAFAPIAIVVKEEEVDIVGCIIEMVKES